jgi:hypothetical protein
MIFPKGCVTSDIEINEKYGIRIASDRGIPKSGYKNYISQTHLVYLVAEFLHGRHVSTSSRSSSGPNLRIQFLLKLVHKMQVGIPVAYNVCEVKLDHINHWICVHRVIGCVKTPERSDCTQPL